MSESSAGVLKVLVPGLHTLVVDRGWPHARSLGVPVGGAADSFALAIGNALVGNDAHAAALEISLAGPTLQASCPLACVLYGAPFDLERDGQRLPAGTTWTLHPGQVLHIGGTSSGMRAYLCVRGGIEAPLVLGSRSGLVPLRAGEELPCWAGAIQGREVRIPDVADWFRTKESVRVLRVLPGAQTHWFGAALGGPFRVSPASNRMGLRLEGAPLAVPAREIVSEPVCPGTVQVMRDGQCIILGIDGQTIGGYPKIAQVISADLDRLGQLRPGEAVTFEYVSLAEAEELYRRRQELLREWVARLRCTEALRIGQVDPRGERSVS
jgi:antagonist of KipI